MIDQGEVGLGESEDVLTAWREEKHETIKVLLSGVMIRFVLLHVIQVHIYIVRSYTCIIYLYTELR